MAKQSCRTCGEARPPAPPDPPVPPPKPPAVREAAGKHAAEAIALYLEKQSSNNQEQSAQQQEQQAEAEAAMDIGEGNDPPEAGSMAAATIEDGDAEYAAIASIGEAEQKKMLLWLMRECRLSQGILKKAEEEVVPHTKNKPERP